MKLYGVNMKAYTKHYALSPEHYVPSPVHYKIKPEHNLTSPVPTSLGCLPVNSSSERRASSVARMVDWLSENSSSNSISPGSHDNGSSGGSSLPVAYSGACNTSTRATATPALRNSELQQHWQRTQLN